MQDFCLDHGRVFVEPSSHLLVEVEIGSQAEDEPHGRIARVVLAKFHRTFSMPSINGVSAMNCSAFSFSARSLASVVAMT
jgi:hypothetical protein